METCPTLRVIIDTDPGVDDAIAILMALPCPSLEVAGLTTVGGTIGDRKYYRDNFTTEQNAELLSRLHQLLAQEGIRGNQTIRDLYLRCSQKDVRLR